MNQVDTWGFRPDYQQLPLDGRYTVIQAAERLGVCRTTVYKAVRRGLLKAINPKSRPLRFYGRAINRFYNIMTS